VRDAREDVGRQARLAARDGARVIITPNASPSSPENFQNVARRMAEENGWFLADQFENPANVRAHEEGTAQEILEQVGGPIGTFVAGAGTRGTITGVGRRLTAVDAQTRVVLADPMGSSLADWVENGESGPDGAYEVEAIGASKVPGNLHRDVIDAAERVTDDESFAMVRRLVREEGLFVGGAALRVAARGGLQGPVITVVCDSWDRYRAKPWLCWMSVQATAHPACQGYCRMRKCAALAERGEACARDRRCREGLSCVDGACVQGELVVATEVASRSPRCAAAAPWARADL